MLTDALDDNDPAQRKLGIEAGLAWRNAYSIAEHDNEPYRVVPIFYVDFGWSEGMKLARDLYSKEGRQYEIRTLGEVEEASSTRQNSRGAESKRMR